MLKTPDIQQLMKDEHGDGDEERETNTVGAFLAFPPQQRAAALSFSLRRWLGDRPLVEHLLVKHHGSRRGHSVSLTANLG